MDNEVRAGASHLLGVLTFAVAEVLATYWIQVELH
jgi:hypothetical protein